MKADDTKAVDAVVNADTHRLGLLAECERLQTKLEKTTATEEEEERLKEASNLLIQKFFLNLQHGRHID